MPNACHSQRYRYIGRSLPTQPRNAAAPRERFLVRQGCVRSCNLEARGAIKWHSIIIHTRVIRPIAFYSSRLQATVISASAFTSFYPQILTFWFPYPTSSIIPSVVGISLRPLSVGFQLSVKMADSIPSTSGTATPTKDIALPAQEAQPVPMADPEKKAAAPPAYSAFSPWRKRFILIVVTVAGCFGPLAGNIYLPALPVLENEFHASATAINVTVSVFMLTFAIGVSVLVPFLALLYDANLSLH